MITQKVMDRFWKKANVQDRDDCWNWVGAISSTGYGNFYCDGNFYPAHKFSWILVNGDVPEGIYVCHHCDNRRCINPNHLFLGTHQDNMDDMVEKGRARSPSRYGEENPASKLTDGDVIRIREFYFLDGYSIPTLAKSFGVGNSIIGSIINRSAWNHISPTCDEVLRGYATGEHHGSSKLKNEDVVIIKEMLRSGIPQTHIAKEFGVNPYTIYAIAKGKTWKHIKEDSDAASYLV